MWSGDEDGDRSGRAHRLLIWVGFGALVVAAFVFGQGITSAQWPTAKAKVLSVEVKCGMTANGASRRGVPAGPVFIACEQVEKFRSDNPGRSWRESKVYTGRLRVMGVQDAVTVALEFPPNSSTPRPGDSFDVLQNPEAPSDIRFIEFGLSRIVAGLCIGGLGIFMLALAFLWF